MSYEMIIELIGNDVELAKKIQKYCVELITLSTSTTEPTEEPTKESKENVEDESEEESKENAEDESWNLNDMKNKIRKNFAKKMEKKELDELLNSITNFKIVSSASMFTSEFSVSFKMSNIKIHMGVEHEANRGGYCGATINGISISDMDIDHPFIDIETCDDIEDETDREKLIELFEKTFPKLEPNHVMSVITSILSEWCEY